MKEFHIAIVVDAFLNTHARIARVGLFAELGEMAVGKSQCQTGLPIMI